MAALPNTGAPSVQRRKVWLTTTTRVPCSNAAKTRNPLKFAGVPQTRQHMSAVSRPKFTILSGHVEEVLLFNKFFRLSIHALVPKMYVSFGQGSSLLWTHTLRPFYSRPIALTQEGRSLVNDVCECVHD